MGAEGADRRGRRGRGNDLAIAPRAKRYDPQSLLCLRSWVGAANLEKIRHLSWRDIQPDEAIRLRRSAHQSFVYPGQTKHDEGSRNGCRAMCGALTRL